LASSKGVNGAFKIKRVLKDSAGKNPDGEKKKGGAAARNLRRKKSRNLLTKLFLVLLLSEKFTNLEKSSCVVRSLGDYQAATGRK